ncbi:MAG: hypothetical protein K6V36_05930 [Anaerolineae bacterium]|nr:hypothetical protein [Anaerolineae bacterium]
MRGNRLALLLAALVLVCCRATGDATSAVGTTPRSAAYPAVTGLDLRGLRSVDSQAGSYPIRYSLSAPALVRVRIVDRNTPGIILRTLVDWGPRPAGEQCELWDGLDDHGEPASPTGVSVLVRAEPPRDLPDDVRQALSQLRHPEEKHFLHPTDLCSDLNVRIEEPADGATVSGVIRVAASLAGNAGIPDGEYHVMVYLDGRDAWDGRVPSPSFSQEFDTRNVPDGEHLLAVTFNDLHDHAGSDWVTLIVDNRSSDTN